MINNKTVRDLAIDILTKLNKDNSYSNISINNYIEKFKLNQKDSSLLTVLVYGTIQHSITINYSLNKFLKKKHLSNWIYSLLRIGTYEIIYLNKIPLYASFNEYINIAKKRCKSDIYIVKFVTAILHNIKRNYKNILSNLDSSIQSISILYSVPSWIIKKLYSQYGKDKTLKILSNINEVSKTSIRVNTTLIKRNELKRKLSPIFSEIKDSQLSPFGLTISGGNALKTNEFLQGLYTFQDESSMLVAPYLHVKPYHKVLDACAAPGGKTTHIAQYLDSSLGGKIVALDIYDHRLKLINSNAERMHLNDKIITIKADARNAKNILNNQMFDRILVDAPCSGLGLMRRKPEIRYNRKKEDIINLSKLQFCILNNVSNLLKVNGLLIYSTCTILYEENQNVILNFLKNHDNFQLVKMKSPDSKSKKDYIQILPDDFYTDGFFIATLRRIY